MKEMKEIKIFIGSSVDKNELKPERKELGSFISGLNRKYIKQGIYIDLYDCETVSNKMRAEGSQKQHDDYIENEADATFFMFFRKAGEFTLHELQIAHDALVNKNRPDIFTYFKVVGDDVEQTDEIKKTVDVIANSYGHYFNKFTDVDTVKLGMLQYIVEKLNDGSSLSISEGKIYLNNMEVDRISINNIFAYQNNSEYRRLKEKLAELDDKINNAIEDKRFRDIEAFTEQKEITEKVFVKLESDIFNMLLNMQKELQKGNINLVSRQAYQLLEMGKIKEAQRLIPIDILKSKSENLLLKNQIQQQDNKDLVENANVRIEALTLDITNKNRFKLIEETYESVLENAFVCYYDEFVYNYCYFLDYQNNSKKAYETAKRLEGLYLLHSERFECSDLADLYNLMGVVCGHLSFFSDQEHYCSEAIKLYEVLAKSNPEKYNPGLAMSCNNAGLFYEDQGDAKQAEFYYTEAIKLFEKLAKNNPKRYNPNLVAIYNNAGIFYYDQGDAKQAEHYYTEAIKLYEKLAKNNPKRYNPDLAMSYNNAGNFYYNQGDTKQAEYYYSKAIKLREELAKSNPERYNPGLATIYNNAGSFYYNQGDTKQAEYYYSKAIKLCEELAKSNPERYNPVLATIYNNAGVFYNNQGNMKQTEHYYSKAINLCEELAKSDPERYNPVLASSYYNAGIFYNNQGNMKQTEHYYSKAIKLCEELAKSDPERYNPVLARSYNNAGIFYYDQGEAKQAEHYYTEAIKLYEKLAKNNPKRYNPDLASSYNNAGNLYDNQGDAKQAEHYYTEAIKLYEKLAKYNPKRYNPNLATIYNNAGNFYNNQVDTKQAEYYYSEAIKLCEELAKSNPERYSPDLAMSYNNAGIFYDDQGDAKQAEHYYSEAIKLREELAKNNPERYNAALSLSYYNYGIFKNDKEYFDKALNLAKTQPDNPYSRQIISTLSD